MKSPLGVSTPVRPMLIPVIELVPSAFALVERADPTGEDGWCAYWKAALADRNLAFEPIEKRSWAVSLDSLTDLNALRTVVMVASLDDTAELANVGPISGGYALTDGDHLIWHSGCCADLSDLASWRQLLTTTSESMFLAHHFIRSVVVDDTVSLTICGEYAKEEEAQVCIIETVHVKEMLENALAQVTRFQRRLTDALAGHVPISKIEQLVVQLTQTK
jgi:hypothetical protein